MSSSAYEKPSVLAVICIIIQKRMKAFNWKIWFNVENVYEHTIPNQGQAGFRLIPKMQAAICYSKAFHVPVPGTNGDVVRGTLSWLFNFFGACTQYFWLE